MNWIANGGFLLYNKSVMKNEMFEREWFRLDNAAKIYPAARSAKWNAVFRMAAVMKSEVNPELLQIGRASCRERV